MIKSQTQLIIRAISEQDRRELANLVHFEKHIHRHLDWRSPVDWIGVPPFFVAEQNNKLVAALACPPDPPGIAWIRLFAVSSGFSVDALWRELWEPVSEQLAEMEEELVIAAIPLNNWFRPSLETSGFNQVDQVIVLMWESSSLALEKIPSPYRIRGMQTEDLEAVELVDHAAFSGLWQFSSAGLKAGFADSASATVIEDKGTIIGYQISTSTSLGGHLARLAVLPQYHNKGVGFAILHDVLTEFKKRGARSVTVNTQINNLSSLALYEKARFHRTGEEYPVYQYHI
jgi:ribosomal protein S18 acetylase RimI-like enzyme